MEIIKLPQGEVADDAADCIRIERTSEGRYSLETSALMECDDEADDDSEAVISGGTYATFEEAEADGLAWAAGLRVKTIYVERS